jgi:hypothetical protein
MAVQHHAFTAAGDQIGIVQYRQAYSLLLVQNKRFTEVFNPDLNRHLVT